MPPTLMTPDRISFCLLSLAASAHFCFYTIERYSTPWTTCFPFLVLCRRLVHDDRSEKWPHFSRASIRCLTFQHTLALTELERWTSSSKLVLSRQQDLPQILPSPLSASAFSIHVRYPRRPLSPSTGYHHHNMRSFQPMLAFWGLRHVSHSSLRESRIFKTLLRYLD